MDVVDRTEKIRFGETTMVFGGSGYRLPYSVTGKAYETNLDSVLKFERYDKGLFGRFKKYLRDEIGVGVAVSDNVIFRKEGKNVVIEWTGKKCPCETGNKSTLKPEDYEELKNLANRCAQNNAKISVV